MLCPKCGKDNAAGARFCNYCGQAMATASAAGLSPLPPMPPQPQSQAPPPGPQGQPSLPPAPPAAKGRGGLITCLIIAAIVAALGILLAIGLALFGFLMLEGKSSRIEPASVMMPAPEPAQPDRFAGPATTSDGSPTATTSPDSFAGLASTSDGARAGPAATGSVDAPAGPPTSPARAAEFEQALRTGNAAAASAIIHPSYRKTLAARLLADPAKMARLAEVLATRRLVAEQRRLAEYEVTDGGRKYPVVFEKLDGQWVLIAF